MKQITLLFVLFFLSSASAFSFSDLFTMELGSFVTGHAVTNKPPSVTLSRPVDTQVVNNPIVFKWRYFDPEDDPLQFYILQIDDDTRFFSPQNYKGLGTEQTLSLDGGTYYWRVKVVNAYGERFSDIWEFYVDPHVKVCEDGTPYFVCSLNKPFYCSAGTLREDCERCGCDSGSNCQSGGSCLALTCNEGTLFGHCALNKPYYCANGKIQQVCSLCGCDQGFECTGTGQCELVVQETTSVEPEPELPRLTFLERVALFFRSLFLGR